MRIVKILLIIALGLFASCRSDQESPLKTDIYSDYISMSDFDALPPGVCTGPSSTQTLNTDTINQTVEGNIFPQIGPTLNHDDLLIFKVWLSPNQRCLISRGSESGSSRTETLRLWDLKTGQAIGEPMVHDATIYGATFNKDGSRILSWGVEGPMRQWDSRSAMQLGPAMHQFNLVKGAKYNKDESLILSHSSWEHSARVWDANTGLPVGRPMKQGNYISSATFNKDESKILTRSWTDVILWDAKTKEQLYKFPKNKKSRSIREAIFINDDTEIIVSEGRRLTFYSSETGKPLPSRIDEYTGGRLKVLPKGKKILDLKTDRRAIAKIFDSKTGQQIGETLKVYGILTDSEISSNNDKWLAGLRDGTAILGDFATGDLLIPKMVHHPNGEDKPNVRAKFSPDERLIATTTLLREPSSTKLWRAETGEQVGETLPGEGEFFASGQMLVTHDDVGNIRLWDISRAYIE